MLIHRLLHTVGSRATVLQKFGVATGVNSSSTLTSRFQTRFSQPRFLLSTSASSKGMKCWLSVSSSSHLEHTYRPCAIPLLSVRVHACTEKRVHLYEASTIQLEWRSLYFCVHSSSERRRYIDTSCCCCCCGCGCIRRHPSLDVSYLILSLLVAYLIWCFVVGRRY